MFTCSSILTRSLHFANLFHVGHIKDSYVLMSASAVSVLLHVVWFENYKENLTSSRYLVLKEKLAVTLKGLQGLLGVLKSFIIFAVHNARSFTQSYEGKMSMHIIHGYNDYITLVY